MSLIDAPCGMCPWPKVGMKLPDLDARLVHQLDAIEARPDGWAQSLEALMVAYIADLDTLRILRGWNPDKAEDSDHTFRRWVRVQATPGGPNNIPIWSRETHKGMTHADVIVLLKTLREEVLS